MIITVDELRAVDGFGEYTDAQLTRKIETVESAICATTHNDFISRLTHEKAYPPDVVEGALALLNWDNGGRDNIGIASEGLSRHSVSYVAYDGNNTISGYPAALMGFLRPYYKARF